MEEQFPQALISLTGLAKKIEELFVQQLDRIAFHHDDAENNYRVQEKRLSTLMVDKSLSDEKHLEYAHAIIKLNDAYKEGFIRPLVVSRILWKS